MKLLSTITFLLLTFSAFSQEKLSYQDGIIKQGEEVLSLEELSVLVNDANITYAKGLSTRHFKFNAEKTKRLRLAGDDKKVARALSSQYSTAGPLLITTGLIMNIWGSLSFFNFDRNNLLVIGVVLGGVAAMKVGFSSYRKGGSSAKFEYRAEKSIYEAVKLYNVSLLEAQ